MTIGAQINMFHINISSKILSFDPTAPKSNYNKMIAAILDSLYIFGEKLRKM